jgi:hypothetical protein
VGALDVDELLVQAPTATASPIATSAVSMVRLSRRDQGHRDADLLRVLRAIATSTTWLVALPAVTTERQSLMSTIYRTERGAWRDPVRRLVFQSVNELELHVYMHN